MQSISNGGLRGYQILHFMTARHNLSGDVGGPCGPKWERGTQAQNAREAAAVPATVRRLGRA